MSVIAGNTVVATVGVGRRPFGVAITPQLSPQHQIEALIARVRELELKKGIETGLTATLEAALASLENDRPAAVMQIEAFNNQAEAMRGNQLTDLEADELQTKSAGRYRGN